MGASNSDSNSTSSASSVYDPETATPLSPATEVSEGDANSGSTPAPGFTKLNYLIKQSSIYVNLVAERLKQQEAQRQQSLEKAAQKEAKKSTTTAATKPVATTTATTRRTARGTAAAAAAAAPAPAKKGAKRGPGRPPKARNGSIVDFFKQSDLDAVAPTKEQAIAEATEEDSKLGEHKGLRPANQPALITGGIMKDYQLQGLDWLVSLYENGLNGILADEMGLGKTLQTISFLAFLRGKGVWGPFLIVGPVSVLSNWVDEIARWAPDIPKVMYHGTPAERAEIRSERMSKMGPEFPIVCTNYEIVMNDKKFLSKYAWKFIIIDEGHRLKNMNCKLIQELKSYNSANRLLLTGTPLQNNLAELWSLLNFLLPEIFDDYQYFEEYFDFSKLQGKDKESHAAFLEEEKKNNLVGSLHALLKPFLLRRVKADVITNLPPKKEYILYAPLSQTQKDLYGALLDHKASEWLQQQVLLAHPGSKKRKLLALGTSGPSKKSKTEDTANDSSNRRHSPRKRTRKTIHYSEHSDSDLSDDEFIHQLEAEAEFSDNDDNESLLELDDYEKSVMAAMKQVSTKKLQNLLMQLRQACNSPHLFYWPWQGKPDDKLINDSGKMMLLERLVPPLLKRNHKVLIFSQFKSMLDIIQEWAETLHGYETCRLDGGISQDIRREEIRRFNTDQKVKLFLLTTRAGGLGINLTASDTVIIFDSDWNPQMDLQAQDRAHRLGQIHPVVVYRFATANTVEQTLLEKADGKRRLEKLIIQKGKFRSLVEETEEEELGSLLLKEDFEKVNVLEKGAQVLSDRELEALLDRSREAFERRSVGEKGEGKAAVRVV
ncbi:SNF2 family N-terminal domain-containing protein [Pyronema omphalodes]|nr:SNF2 family N-terminal domain-containing protein [Pyronema omphalodes]